jgi:glutamate/tyrosine decarboxylase-like PLP-dependent enzyme
MMPSKSLTDKRNAPVDMSSDEFRKAGYALVDQIAEFLSGIAERPVTQDFKPSQIKALIDGSTSFPEQGQDAHTLLQETAQKLFDNSTFNGHPKFWGYITSSATPIGILGEMLAASVNPNVGAWGLAPLATEIERQTIRWIAEFIGYNPDCGGLLVSGGNMANFVGVLAARKAKSDWNVREEGLKNKQLIIYASQETHTWVQKAADLFGIGTQAIRWIPVNEQQQIDLKQLDIQIQKDREAGTLPFMLVGTAGSVSTGAVDPLQELAALAKTYDLWFHVDGAYGSFAAGLPEASPDLKAIRLADSIAMDPHKWLYSPLEAGAVLVKKPEHLLDAFSYRPPYYHFDEGEEPKVNFYEYGLQNSRGFRALKVWLSLKQAGKEGYTQMIREDIQMIDTLAEAIKLHPNLELFSNNLSIAAFRYIPDNLERPDEQAYLNKLNTAILNRIQEGGEAFISNAVQNDNFYLRACIVNFRTTVEDILSLPELVIRIGQEIDAELRNQN